jgi:hypothetical protein
MLQGASRLQCDPNHDSISTCLLYIYIYKYNYLRLREHTMFIWNLLDGGLSHSRPLFGPSESIWGDTRISILVSSPYVFGK